MASFPASRAACSFPGENGAMHFKKDPTALFTTGNQVRLIHSGRAYFQFLYHLFNCAKHSIHVRIYLWAEDETGRAVAAALMAAARRGVAVYVIADGYASQGLSRRFLEQLQQSGIHFRFFEPLLRSYRFYFGRRMHEKLIVVDGARALVGGINFADRYNQLDHNLPWLDYALFVKGTAAASLDSYCAAFWGKQASKHVAATGDRGSCCSVRLRRNDWIKGKNEVWRTYFHAFNQAKKSITIVCSYFLPGNVLRHRLVLAAKRGVRVKIVLAGSSDVMLAKHAERYLYRWMIRHGIEIYEYQPAVLHAKLMVVDEHLVTVGSFNVNNISAYASLELNLDIRNRPFAGSVQQMIDELIERACIRIKRKSVAQLNVVSSFLQKTAYELVRLAVNLSTFYFRHE